MKPGRGGDYADRFFQFSATPFVILLLRTVFYNNSIFIISLNFFCVNVFEKITLSDNEKYMYTPL